MTQVVLGESIEFGGELPEKLARLLGQEAMAPFMLDWLADMQEAERQNALDRMAALVTSIEAGVEIDEAITLFDTDILVPGDVNDGYTVTSKSLEISMVIGEPLPKVPTHFISKYFSTDRVSQLTSAYVPALADALIEQYYAVVPNTKRQKDRFKTEIAGYLYGVSGKELAEQFKSTFGATQMARSLMFARLKDEIGQEGVDALLVGVLESDLTDAPELTIPIQGIIPDINHKVTSERVSRKPEVDESKYAHAHARKFAQKLFDDDRLATLLPSQVTALLTVIGDLYLPKNRKKQSGQVQMERLAKYCRGMTNTELAAEFGIADSGIVQGRDCVIEIIKRSYGASELSQALIRVFPPPPKPKEEEPVIVMKGYSGLPVYTYEDAKKAEAEGLVSFDMVMPSAGDLEWQERALCAQTDPEAFFPEKGGSTREAKRVCTTCDVRVDCLEYALKNDERFGIWGGLSERERRRLKKASV